MDIRENWDQLNQRVKEENGTLIAGLMRIHMGAFDDLRKNGHRINANGQPVSILAPRLSANERLGLACQIGRSLIEAQTGSIDGGFAEICTIRQADYFPNCIAIALGAILESIHPGPPGKRMTVRISYDTVRGNQDPLKEKLSALAPCFPWADFQPKVTEQAPQQPVKAPVLPLEQMGTLFRAEGMAKIDTARMSFSGSVIRGEIREGDVLNVTDGNGQQICPPGLVMKIYLKDRVENGKVVGEHSPMLRTGQRADSLLMAVEIPKGSYSGVALSKEEGAREQADAPCAGAKPAAGEASADTPRNGLLSRLFGKRKS